MKTFYCRMGSKKTIRKEIIRHIPPHKTYVEPFFGSGAVFFEKEPSEVEVISDKDKELMKDYKMLKNTKVKEEDIPPASLFNTAEKLNTFYKEAPDTPINRLVRAILIRCYTFRSFGKGNLYLPYPSKNPTKKLYQIPEYKKRLKKVKILEQSYEPVMKKYDAPDTFFYLDPPYEKSELHYKEGVMDYKKMRNILDKIEGKWLLSINDSQEIRELFKGYYYKMIKAPTTGGFYPTGQKKRPELLIANYPL